MEDGTARNLKMRKPEKLKSTTKSLLQFRCVCKSWLALISYPNFARKHISTYTSRLKLLETVNPSRSIDFEATLKDDDRVGYTALPEAPRLWVLGSCIGLICREEDKGGDLILWNPSTRDTYKLPEQIKTRYRQFFGFGYDSTNEDYKVIVGLETEITVFTLKTGSWKIVEQSEYVGRFYGEGCLLNGALHWLEDSRSKFTIISFDLVEEKFQELPPPNICRKEVSGRLGIGKTIGNCLFLYLYDSKHHTSQTGGLPFDMNMGCNSSKYSSEQDNDMDSKRKGTTIVACFTKEGVNIRVRGGL
ncbi:F-box/kelch-repeat protein At3g23880-like [Rosa rugosa]|uniref:F-box/kelch-repeat protein At3g23880-like n=1 Tax=Rosa rugosa TaxID=74645 RepID=UPI002B4139ED|nr:F-box/kelch-repeat protein At3g23880-like [Rosa rugosa]